jgi:hypothetical protein
MERFMWGFDGRKFSELVEPIRFERNERVRVTLVNDSMMSHPIHLHGHFFELVTGGPAGHQPLKHTVNVAPGSKVAFDLTADAPGDWAFHCHKSHLVLMMNISDDRNRRTWNNLGKTFRSFDLVACASHNVATRGSKRINLLQGTFDIGSLCGGH